MRKYKEIPVFSPKALAKFWSLVERKSDSECWPWLGRVTVGKWGAKYGFWRGYRPHRITFTLLVGPIPEGLTLDHLKELCNLHGLCANPAHTEPCTQGENTVRHHVFVNKTACKNGHPRRFMQECLWCRRPSGAPPKCNHPGIPLSPDCPTCSYLMARFRELDPAAERRQSA